MQNKIFFIASIFLFDQWLVVAWYYYKLFEQVYKVKRTDRDDGWRKKTIWERWNQSSTGNYCHVTLEFEGKISKACAWICVYICCKFKYIHFLGSVNKTRCMRRNRNKTGAIVCFTWLYGRVQNHWNTEKTDCVSVLDLFCVVLWTVDLYSRI